jgi:hypothetical protein
VSHLTFLFSSLICQVKSAFDSMRAAAEAAAAVSRIGARIGGDNDAFALGDIGGTAAIDDVDFAVRVGGNDRGIYLRSATATIGGAVNRTGR